MRAIRTLGVMLFAVIGTIDAARAAAGDGAVRFDESTKIFRLDAAKVTYAFGVDDKGQLQSLYWGPRLGASDHPPVAVAPAKGDAIDGDINRVRQEYAG